jgi:hypothetical protein
VLFGVGNGTNFVGALKPWRGNVDGLIGQIQQVPPRRLSLWEPPR